MFFTCSIPSLRLYSKIPCLFYGPGAIYQSLLKTCPNIIISGIFWWNHHTSDNGILVSNWYEEIFHFCKIYIFQWFVKVFHSVLPQWDPARRAFDIIGKFGGFSYGDSGVKRGWSMNFITKKNRPNKKLCRPILSVTYPSGFNLEERYV